MPRWLPSSADPSGRCNRMARDKQAAQQLGEAVLRKTDPRPAMTGLKQNLAGIRRVGTSHQVTLWARLRQFRQSPWDLVRRTSGSQVKRPPFQPECSPVGVSSDFGGPTARFPGCHEVKKPRIQPLHNRSLSIDQYPPMVYNKGLCNPS